MSGLRPVFVAVTDLHLSDNPPIFRSAEKDWFAAMQRPLGELERLAQSLRVPIVCAGDVFHRWDPSPALINFSLKHLPVMYAIPGQHDLPHHRYADIQRTAYWTMVETGRIINLKPGNPYPIEGAVLHGCPWGFDVEAACKPTTDPIDGFHCAVIHQYIWTKKATYPGAPPEAHLSHLVNKLNGFTLAITGDNHLPFSFNTSRERNQCSVFNAGGFMRRNSDQESHESRVGIVYEGGVVKSHYLDCSEDRCHKDDREKESPEVRELKFETFLAALAEERGSAFDYEQVLRCYAESQGVSPEAAALVLKSLEKRRTK